MKISRMLMVFLATFFIAIGAAFFVNSGWAGNTACAMGVSAACGKCGDGYCNPRCGETSKNCPRDCGVTSAK